MRTESLRRRNEILVDDSKVTKALITRIVIAIEGERVVMMHQTQRLISLADEITQIRPGKESLQLLFLMICVENIAKLFHNFEGEGQSKKYVRRFFDEFVAGADREILESSFTKDLGTPSLDLATVIDTLYSSSR